MKKHLFTLVLLLSFLPFIGFSQMANLVGNGDFETSSTFPTGAGQLANSIGWSNLNGFTGWPYGTPDYFHGSGTGGTAWPNTYAGDIVPQSGNSLSGFITNNFFSPDFREYISYDLESDMEVGETYTISFWLSNGSSNWYAGRGSNNIGIAFTMNQPSQIQHEALTSIEPQLEITTVVHHTVWQQYSFTFSPTAAFRYMTIGNFRNDLSTTYATFTSGNGIAFYFIDNVNVSEAGVLNAEAIALTQLENDEALVLRWEMPSNADGSTFMLERSTDEASFMGLEASSVAGSQLNTQNYVDPTALPGQVYFYRLRETNADGYVSYSPVIEATFGKPGGYAAGNIFPNPVTTQFSIEFASIDQGSLAMELIDMEGRVVMTEAQDITSGQVRLSYDVPLGLSAGVYHARFSFGVERFNRQVLVVAAN